MARLDRLGFNCICFAVDDIEAVVAELRANGVEVRGELSGFHDRRPPRAGRMNDDAR